MLRPNVHEFASLGTSVTALQFVENLVGDHSLSFVFLMDQGLPQTIASLIRQYVFSNSQKRRHSAAPRRRLFSVRGRRR